MTYPIIRDPIIIIVRIASIAGSIFVVVFLPRVGKIRTVVLKCCDKESFNPDGITGRLLSIW